LADLWLVIRKRRVLLAVMALGLAALGVLGGYVHGKRYTAGGDLQIEPNAAADLKSSIAAAVGSGGGSFDDTMESDVHILQSPTLLLQVARSLDLQNDPDFAGKEAAKQKRSLDNPYVAAGVVASLTANLDVERVPGTQIISIAYKSRSPQLSVAVVNTLESRFVENNFITGYNTTKEVTKWLTGQMDDLRSAVQTSQDQMVTLQRKLGLNAFDPNHSLMVQQIGNLDKQISDATEQRVLAEARYRILASLPPDQILDSPTVLGTEGSLLSDLRAQRDEAEAQLANLRPVYGPKYPKVVQLNAQIAALDRQLSEEEARVVKQAKDAYGVAQAAENKAKGMLEGQEQQAYGQRDDIVQYMLVSQEYDSNRLMYESLLARLREAAVDAGLNAADVNVVDLASLPTGPSSLSPVKLGVIGLLLGAFGGLGMALFLEKIDTRLRDAHDIQEILGLPSLAVIPQSHWKSRESELEMAAGPELLRDPRSPFAEAFRALRTSMRLSTTSRESKVIAVTSCQPAEGKSTIAVNMAAVLAQGGKRVVLVDTDMRRPSVYKRLRMEGGKGLSEVLTGYFTLDEVIHTHETLKTLDIIPSGTVPPLPADLLASDQMVELVRQLRERYDYVLFDTPPVLSVTDPAIVAAQSDGLVLVIRQGYCTRRMLSRAAEILQDLDVKVYGFVFNGVDARLPEYYGYLGYYTYEYGK
jgi:succinoglycan biosynthesis transport protein ExoP